MQNTPYDPAIDLSLALAHQAAGRKVEAENILRQLLLSAPDFHPAYHLRGLLAFESGNMVLATELIAKAISLNDSVALYHLNFGELCRRQGRLDEAVLAAQRAAVLSPVNLDARYNLGLALFGKGEFAAAVDAYHAALALNPVHGPSLNNLGSALNKLGQLAEAEAAFSRAVQLNPKHREALLNLQALYQQQGRSDEARRCLESLSAIKEEAASRIKPQAQRKAQPINPPAASVRDTGSERGRGVFAQRNFAAGEIIESSPVVIFDSPFMSFPDELKRIVFSWGLLCGTGTSHAVALGYGSLYNHNDPANMRYQADPENRVLKFIAARNITAGEELTVNYNAVGGGASWSDTNWFDRMKIRPITST